MLNPNFAVANLPSADEIFLENLSGLTPKSHKMACFGTDASGQCLTNFVSSDPSGRFCSPTAKSGSIGTPIKAEATF